MTPPFASSSPALSPNPAFRVDACGQGAEAERLALEGIHDALVVDLTLPDIDGLELIQRLRSRASPRPSSSSPRAAPSTSASSDSNAAATTT